MECKVKIKYKGEPNSNAWEETWKNIPDKLHGRKTSKEFRKVLQAVVDLFNEEEKKRYGESAKERELITFRRIRIGGIKYEI